MFKVFAGECIPDLDKLFSDKGLFSENDQDYPHAWKAGIGCFIIGLGIMVLTVVLSLCLLCADLFNPSRPSSSRWGSSPSRQVNRT